MYQKCDLVNCSIFQLSLQGPPGDIGAPGLDGDPGHKINSVQSLIHKINMLYYLTSLSPPPSLFRVNKVQMATLALQDSLAPGP